MLRIRWFFIFSEKMIPPSPILFFFASCCLSSHLSARVGIGQSPDSSRCSVSPASAFAIATAAAGHGSPQGQTTPMPSDGVTTFTYDKAVRRRSSHTVLFQSHSGFNNSDKTYDKEFLIRRAATNRVLNVLRHWVSKHSQVCATFFISSPSSSSTCSRLIY